MLKGKIDEVSTGGRQQLSQVFDFFAHANGLGLDDCFEALLLLLHHVFVHLLDSLAFVLVGVLFESVISLGRVIVHVRARCCFLFDDALQVLSSIQQLLVQPFELVIFSY